MAPKSGQPLAVGHVSLAAGNILDVSGIDQNHLDATFQDIMPRLPLNPSACQGDKRTAMLPKPIPQSEQLIRQSAKFRHCQIIQAIFAGEPEAGGNNLFIMFMSPDYHPSRYFCFGS